VALKSNDESALAEHAAEIKRLGQRAADDVIEIGRRLTECKRLVGHGNWLSWLEQEFGWSDETARKYMRCFDFARDRKFQPSWNMANSALQLLARPSTPEDARDEIVARAKAGEPISAKAVRSVAAQVQKRFPIDVRPPAGGTSEPMTPRIVVIKRPTTVTNVRPRYEKQEPTRVSSVRVRYVTQADDQDEPTSQEPAQLARPETTIIVREILSLAIHVRNLTPAWDAIALLEALPQQEQRDEFVYSLKDISLFVRQVQNALAPIIDGEPPTDAKH
jgi:hypothetical protein